MLELGSETDTIHVEQYNTIKHKNTSDQQLPQPLEWSAILPNANIVTWCFFFCAKTQILTNP